MVDSPATADRPADRRGSSRPGYSKPANVAGGTEQPQGWRVLESGPVTTDTVTGSPQRGQSGSDQSSSASRSLERSLAIAITACGA